MRYRKKETDRNKESRQRKRDKKYRKKKTEQCWLCDYDRCCKNLFCTFETCEIFIFVRQANISYLTIIEGVMVLPDWFGLVGLGHQHRQAVLGHVLAEFGHIVAEYAQSSCTISKEIMNNCDHDRLFGVNLRNEYGQA